MRPPSVSREARSFGRLGKRSWGRCQGRRACSGWNALSTFLLRKSLCGMISGTDFPLPGSNSASGRSWLLGGGALQADVAILFMCGARSVHNAEARRGGSPRLTWSVNSLPSRVSTRCPIGCRSQEVVCSGAVAHTKRSSRPRGMCIGIMWGGCMERSAR